jgi:hypothetical protein
MTWKREEQTEARKGKKREEEGERVPNVHTLGGGESIEHAVVEVDELLEHALARPGVVGVLAASQATFSEIDAHSINQFK